TTQGCKTLRTFFTKHICVWIMAYYRQKEITLMSDQAAGVLVTVDIVIPRLSPSSSEWEVALIQRKKQLYEGMWAFPGGHLTVDDPSLELVANGEVRKKPGLNTPYLFFQQVKTINDLEVPAINYSAW